MEQKTENKPKRPHAITLDGRIRASLTGVEKVVNSADTFINLVTSEGGLNIAGRDFKIEKFNIDDGTLVLAGVIDGIKYTAAKAPLLKRIFK